MRTTRPLAVALLVAFTPALLPSRVALAQTAADDASTKMARQRFQEGVQFYDQKQYEAARASFLQAYALRKHPLVLLNLGQSSLKSGHTLEAARYLSQFLREYTQATPAERGDAERGLREARQKLGRVEVAGVPNGTDVFVDDERVGVTPLDQPIDVDPGTHMVKARGDAVQVTVNGGQLTTARFGMSQPPAVAPVPVPAASAPSSPPSEESAQASPSPPAEPQPESAPPPAESADQGASGHNLLAPPKNMTPVWIGGAVAVVGAATAITFYFFKQSAQSSADSVTQTIVSNGGTTCQTSSRAYNPRFANACNALSSDNDKVNQDALIGNIATGVAIGAAVLTAAYYLLANKEDSSAPATTGRTTVAPLFGNGVGGLQVGGAF